MQTLFGSLILATLIPAGAAPAIATQADEFQVRAKTLVLADGSRVDGGVVVVGNGKITRVLVPEAGESSAIVVADLPLIEHDGFITAGFVACQTRSGTRAEATDNTRAFLAAAHMVHAFDPEHSDFESALRAGITTVVLVPTGVNVAGGLTAVVKTFGGEVISAEGHLALSLSSTPLHQTVATSKVIKPGAPDRGVLEQTDSARRGTRGPTSFPGVLAELSARMEAGDGAFGRIAGGELPVLIEAWSRNEVARATSFAKMHGLRGALRGVSFASDPDLLPLVQASGLAVVVGPFVVGQSRRSIESVARLQEAGVPVAFALDGPLFDANSFRLSAVLALSAGADAAAVLASLTTEGARIAGVDDRVGSLEAGKDADFVLWSGDPLNLASRVQAVYVDGERAFSATESDN